MMPNCWPSAPMRRISLSRMSSFSSCTCLAMVEAPPSKNHKTRIPFWHPRNNKLPSGSLVTTLLTSLRHAGGEADAISLLCFALTVYQTISDLSTGKSRFFSFFFVNSFPRGGNTIFCTQTVPPRGQERRHVPCRRKTGRATRKTLRRSPTSRRTRKTTASKPAAIPYASGPEFPGRFSFDFLCVH